MKIGLVAMLLLFSLPFSAIGEAKSPEKKTDPIAYLCPLFSVGDYPPDALYYCDYVTPACEWLDVSYFFGQLPTVPYQTCHEDCAPVYLVPKAFPGLRGKVAPDYLPTQPMLAAKPIPEFSGSPVRLYVNKSRNHLYITFTVEGKRFAKVIEYRFYGPIHNRCQDCADMKAGNKAPKKIDFGWQTAFVAFECDALTGGEEVLPVEAFEDVLPGNYVKRGRIKHEAGSDETLPVLILLAQPPGPEKPKK